MSVPGEQLDHGARDGVAVLRRVHRWDNIVGVTVQYVHRHVDADRPRGRTSAMRMTKLQRVVTKTDTTERGGTIRAEGEQVGAHPRIVIKQPTLQRTEAAA